MEIKLDSTKRKFFRQVLEILSPLPPFNTIKGLKARQKLDVLAEMLYYNYKYKHIDKLLRYKILFDYETKIKMREDLNIGEHTFNNITSELRKKGFITQRGLVSDFGIDPDKSNELKFKFEFDE